MTPEHLISAMRATAIPKGSSGLWVVRKHVLDKPTPHTGEGGGICEPGLYTSLHCYTDATLATGGECVMEDTSPELRLHLEFIMRARGRVLVMGLGLGCVVRGLMENPRVTHVDVVEREQDVLDLVRPHASFDDRVEVHHADAFEYLGREPRARWNCAWHDLWSDPNRKEKHLALTHSRLFVECFNRCELQGAWALPRAQRRAFQRLKHKKTGAPAFL